MSREQGQEARHDRAFMPDTYYTGAADSMWAQNTHTHACIPTRCLCRDFTLSSINFSSICSSWRVVRSNGQRQPCLSAHVLPSHSLYLTDTSSTGWLLASHSSVVLSIQRLQFSKMELITWRCRFTVYNKPEICEYTPVFFSRSRLLIISLTFSFPEC